MIHNGVIHNVEENAMVHLLFTFHHADVDIEFLDMKNHGDEEARARDYLKVFGFLIYYKEVWKEEMELNVS